MDHTECPYCHSDICDEINKAVAEKKEITKKYMAELTTELERFRAALNKIASMHQDYCHNEIDSTETDMYKFGIVDGHRCAGKVAKTALDEEVS